MTEHEPAEEQHGDATSQAAPSAGTPESSIERQLEEERAKADRYLQNWQRAQADFMNYKRRVEGEREDIRRLSTASLIINLLPLIDDLERALSSVDTALAGLTWIDGIRLIHRKFQALLEAHGVTEIAAEGQDFDPNVHEAAMYEEGPEGKVIRELQRGYKLGDRVIRPAMVIVGKGTSAESRPDGDQSGTT